jgi:hypothetical protein
VPRHPGLELGQVGVDAVDLNPAHRALAASFLPPLPSRPCGATARLRRSWPPPPSLRAGKGVSGSPGVRLCRPPVSPPRTGPRTSASGVTRPCPPTGRGRGFASYALDRPTRLRLANGRPLERRFPAPVAVLAWPGLLRPRAFIRAHATYSTRIQHSV